MTPTEALDLLESPDCDLEAQSRMNPSFTCGDMLEVVRAGIEEISLRSEGPLNSLMEKRVHQAVQNQMQPVCYE